MPSIDLLITQLSAVNAISEIDRQIISDAFEVRCYKEGNILSKGDAICRELFFVLDGVLRIVKINEKGNELTHFFVKEGQFCTILHSFDNEVIAEEGIQAACDVKVLAISKANLTKLYECLPYLKAIIDQITQHRLLEKIRIRNSYLGEESASRYQLFLQQQPDIAQRVALKDIASYLGITPQSLSRLRKNF